MIQSIQKNGKNWNILSEIINKRKPKSIRDRYLNNFDPNILKEIFTIEEDVKILKLQKKFGNKWTLISKIKKNRTKDMIKHRFLFHIKKNLNFYDKKINEEKDLSFLDEEFVKNDEINKNKINHNEKKYILKGFSKHKRNSLKYDLFYFNLPQLISYLFLQDIFFFNRFYA